MTRLTGAGLVAVLAIAGAAQVGEREVLAADTVETWGVGATDVDFYLGFDGLRAAGGGSFGDIMLGYGLIERFSAYLGTTLQGSEDFADGEASIYLGIFGTILDTDHVDLDLFLNVSTGGPALAEFELAPALELNVDLDPTMRSWGAYLRAGCPVHGREIATAPQPEPGATPSSEATYHVASTLGVYRTIRDRHQVLVEYTVDWHPDAMRDERRIDVGGVALGYNVALDDRLELITQLYVDVPQRDDTTAYGVMAGFIATLPSAR